MSIIYEALKKLEKNQTTPAPAAKEGQPQEKPKNNLLKTLGGFLLIAVIGFAGASLFFSLFTKPLSPKQAATPNNIPVKEAPLPKPEPAPIRQEQIPQPAPQTETPQPASQEKQEPQANPKPQFILNGIFFSGEEGYALINNQILKEGDTIEGAIVKHISAENGVELDLNGSPVKLNSLK